MNKPLKAPSNSPKWGRIRLASLIGKLSSSSPTGGVRGGFLDSHILHIAIPAIVTNITVPLLGLVDVAIAGHLGSQLFIAAIAIGSMVFNVIYWVLGFLRMGTSGLTAQAYGSGDDDATTASLFRSLLISEAIGLLIILFRHPIFSLAMLIMSPPDGVEPLVATYFHICVWGAPAMIGLYSLTGWLVGLQDTRVPMTVAIVQNVVNIVASLLLVVCFGWEISGVATGTLVAQWTGFVLAIVCICLVHRRKLKPLPLSVIVDMAALRRFANVNVFIFLRTLCLVCVNLYFVAYGSRQGVEILAANTLLMQLFTIFSYFMDGFAYSAEALCGYAVGEMKTKGHQQWSLPMIVRHEFAWGFAMALIFTVIYAMFGNSLLGLLTSEGNVVAAAQPYFPYAVLIPIVGMAAFVCDGVLIGLTASVAMMAACAAAAAAFALIVYSLSPILANHSLWIAYLSFLLVRGVIEFVWINRSSKLTSTHADC